MSYLEYNDVVTKNGVIQAEEDYCELGDAGITGNSLLLMQFTRHNNNALSKIWSWIFQACGGTYDDSNQTNLPASTAALSSLTSKYALPSEALTVVAIEITNSSGTSITLTPTTNEEILAQGIPLTDFGRLSGVPSKYIWKGDTVLLDYIPPSDWTIIKYFYDRGSVAFAYDDLAQRPGFVSEFHNAVPCGGSIEYLKVHKPQSSVLIQLLKDWDGNEDATGREGGYKKSIKEFYAARFKARKPIVMTPHFNPQGCE
jgi:hypothetical protein